VPVNVSLIRSFTNCIYVEARPQASCVRTSAHLDARLGAGSTEYFATGSIISRPRAQLEFTLARSGAGLALAEADEHDDVLIVAASAGDGELLAIPRPGESIQPPRSRLNGLTTPVDRRPTVAGTGSVRRSCARI
jgi:hypothetical protein